MEGVLNKNYVPTETMIKNLIEIELGHLNTSHPDFVNGLELLQLRQREN